MLFVQRFILCGELISNTCNTSIPLLCIWCMGWHIMLIYCISSPLKEMGSCDQWGSWSNGHGFISKGLRGGGPRFNSCNKNHLKNNFMLDTTQCVLSINSRLQLWKQIVFYPYSFMFFLFLPMLIFFRKHN